MSEEKRGKFLDWNKSVDEAINMLVAVANGVPWQLYMQHETDTRGIVTERGARAIREEIESLNDALSGYLKP